LWRSAGSRWPTRRQWYLACNGTGVVARKRKTTPQGEGIGREHTDGGDVAQPWMQKLKFGAVDDAYLERLRRRQRWPPVVAMCYIPPCFMGASPGLGPLGDDVGTHAWKGTAKAGASLQVTGLVLGTSRILSQRQTKWRGPFGAVMRAAVRKIFGGPLVVSSGQDWSAWRYPGRTLNGRNLIGRNTSYIGIPSRTGSDIRLEGESW